MLAKQCRMVGVGVSYQVEYESVPARSSCCFHCFVGDSGKSTRGSNQKVDVLYVLVNISAVEWNEYKHSA